MLCGTTSRFVEAQGLPKLDELLLPQISVLASQHPGLWGGEGLDTDEPRWHCSGTLHNQTIDEAAVFAWCSSL